MVPRAKVILRDPQTGSTVHLVHDIRHQPSGGPAQMLAMMAPLTLSLHGFLFGSQSNRETSLLPAVAEQEDNEAMKERH